MAKPRKTFSVEEIRSHVNNMLLNSVDSRVGERRGAAHVLSTVLHTTGNYRGYGYLSKSEMLPSTHGTTYGIGDKKEDGSWDFEGTDNTRVHYS